MKKSEHNHLGIICMIITAIFFFMIISIFSGQSSLVVCGMLVFVLGLITLTLKSEKLENFLKKNYTICLLINLLVVGIIQMSNMEILRFKPSFDLNAIFGGAIQWIEQGSFYSYYDYYDWFPNNLGGMCVLYFFFRIGRLFTSDYFIIAAGGNEILFLFTLLLISLSAKKMWGERYGIIALLSIECLLPVFFITDAFYTDALSMLFPVLLFYLYLHIKEGKILKLSLLSAVVAAFGILIKGTVGMMAAAIALSSCYSENGKNFLYIHYACWG